MSYHVALQVGRFHDLFALFTFCALFHSHPVFNILVVGETFLGEEPQAAYVAVVSEVLQGQLGQVRIQRLHILLRGVHLLGNIKKCLVKVDLKPSTFCS